MYLWHKLKSTFIIRHTQLFMYNVLFICKMFIIVLYVYIIVLIVGKYMYMLGIIHTCAYVIEKVMAPKVKRCKNKYSNANMQRYNNFTVETALGKLRPATKMSMIRQASFMQYDCILFIVQLFLVLN